MLEESDATATPIAEQVNTSPWDGRLRPRQQDHARTPRYLGRGHVTASVNNSANVMTLRTFVVNRCNSLAFHVLGLYLAICSVVLFCRNVSRCQV